MPAISTYVTYEKGQVMDADLTSFVWIERLWLLAIPTTIILAALVMWLGRSQISNERELVTDTDVRHYIRRHNGHDTYYDDAVVNDDPTVVMPLRRTHWAINNEMWRDSEHPVGAPTTGRHALENPARTIVPADWRPPVGRMRIALLSTMTSEYMLVRRPLELTSR